MRKIKLTLSILSLSLLLLNSCGYKKLNKGNNNQFYINKISTNGEKRIGYLVKNIIQINSSPSSKNKLNIDINLKKIKNSKERNISKKTTKYELTIIAEVKIIEENKSKVINKIFEKSITYQVERSHSTTLNNEKTSIADLTEKVADDIVSFLYIYFED
jgi:hypothetical protein